MNNLSPDDMQLLQAWLDQTLPEEERQALESRLQNEPELRTGAEELRVLLNKIHILRRQEWQNKLKIMHFESLDDLEEIAKRGRWKWIWWVVIGVAVFFSVLLMYKNSEQNSQSLSPIAQEATEFVERNWPAPMGSAKDEVLFKQAGKAFQNKNYRRTIKKLKKYLITNPLDWDAEFMLLVAYLKKGEGKLAFPIIQKMESNGESYELSIWYKAISLIQQNKINEARPLLKELASEANAFQQNAQKLLSKMD